MGKSIFLCEDLVFEFEMCGVFLVYIDLWVIFDGDFVVLMIVGIKVVVGWV